LTFTGWKSAYQLFEEGPAIDIHWMEIEGPVDVIESLHEKKRREGPVDVIESLHEKKRREELVPRFMSAAPADAAPKDKVEPIIEQLLSKAFRRPATDADVKRYGSIVIGHMNSGHRLEEGLHLAIRTSLISPQFLYRGHRPGFRGGASSRNSHLLDLSAISVPGTSTWKVGRLGFGDSTFLLPDRWPTR